MGIEPSNHEPRRTMPGLLRPLILGTGSDGSTSPCILLTCPRTGGKLLLNCTECLQRLSCEHGLKLHRDLDGVLLTSLEPSAVAGLPGLLLLMGDAGIARVHVFGPRGTADFVRSLTRFVQPRTQTQTTLATCAVHTPRVSHVECH